MGYSRRYIPGHCWWWRKTTVAFYIHPRKENIVNLRYACTAPKPQYLSRILMCSVNQFFTTTTTREGGWSICQPFISAYPGFRLQCPHDVPVRLLSYYQAASNENIEQLGYVAGENMHFVSAAYETELAGSIIAIMHLCSHNQNFSHGLICSLWHLHFLSLVSLRGRVCMSVPPCPTGQDPNTSPLGL